MGTTAWAVAGTAAAPVTSVTAATAPVWGDGAPDLFAATGHDVLGSDDALTFASLPGLPDLSADAWPAVAWAGQPERALLIAGAQQAGFFGSGPSWVSGATGLDGLVGAVAPGGQSVAYLLDAQGRLSRTLSAGREPSTVTLTQRPRRRRRQDAAHGDRPRRRPRRRRPAHARPRPRLDHAAQRRLDGRGLGPAP